LELLVQAVSLIRRVSLPIVVVIGISGCAAKVAIPMPPPTATTTTAAATAGPDVKLSPVDKVGFDAILKQHSGNVVLVDFWGTRGKECGPGLAHLVELNEKFGAAGLVVMSVSFDDTEKSDEALNFLRGQKATLKNYRAVDGNAEKSFLDFEIDGGALPHFKLYDRSGKLWKTFAVDPRAETKFTLEDIDAAVEKLLAVSDDSANGRVAPAEAEIDAP
jgi:hypothetical protein